MIDPLTLDQMRVLVAVADAGGPRGSPVVSPCRQGKARIRREKGPRVTFGYQRLGGRGGGQRYRFLRPDVRAAEHQVRDEADGERHQHAEVGEGPRAGLAA